MTKNDAECTTINIHIPKRMKEELTALSRCTNRSKSLLATEALDAYLKANAWQVRKIEEAVQELDQGEPTILHDDVVAWMRSWNTDRELPRPVA